jgi:hypothetical protein
MQLDEFLAQTGGVGAIARELGIPQADAQAGAAALVPAILGGFGKRAPATDADSFGGLLDELGGDSLLDDLIAPQPTPVGRGDDVLAQIFGTKDVSRTVAQHAAGRTGLSPTLLRKMLPLVAMMVTGYLSRRARAQRGGGAPAGRGGFGDVLGSILGGAAARRSGNPFGTPAGGGGAFGGLGGLGAMLDADGNGNPLDDILRQAARR